MENEMSRKIKELRLANGMTLEQVAEIVGVGKSTVRKWETGMIANMKRDKIALLAKALSTTPAYLMGWFEEEKTEIKKEKSIEYDGLSEKRKALIDFALTVPEDKAEMLLRVMKSIVEGD